MFNRNLSMAVCVLAVFAALVCCAAPSGVVSDVEVHRNGMAGKNLPTLRYISHADGTIEIDNRDTCKRGIDGFNVEPGRRAVYPLPVSAASPLRTEHLTASAEEVVKKGFRYELEIDFTDIRGDELLVAVPGALHLYFRAADVKNEKGLQENDVKLNNYVNFPLPDGGLYVIEALVPGPSGRIGIPPGCLKRPTGVKKVVLNHTGVHWQIYIEDSLDENFPFTEITWPKNGATAYICSPRVKSAEFSAWALDDIGRTRYGSYGTRPLDKAVQYFTPSDHNAWIGDVVVGYYGGRFHVFYLFDRRHHRSKSGRGGHCFAHLSSTDLVRWLDHGTAVPLEERWETHGTGTPFVWDGKFCLAYGLHTARSIANEKTTIPTMTGYRKKHGHEGLFRMKDLAPLVPRGATYAVSRDGGFTFEKTGMLISTSENPGIYNLRDGKLGLADYTRLYRSDRLGGWKLWDDKTRARGDCPCAFEWNGHHYLIQGFFTMSYSPDGTPGSYVSWSDTGDDVYDGLSVPMVAPFAGNRRILAGWINHVGGWGGWLCLRELVQEPDGKLGIKWLKETPPPVRPFEWPEVDHTKPFVVKFICETIRDMGLEFRIDPREGRAQYAATGRDGKAARQRTAREMLQSLKPAERTYAKMSALRAPFCAGSYAIEKIRGLDRPFGVRLAAWYDVKSNATVFDAEIAGRRTMVCRRPGRWKFVSAGSR